MRRKRLTAVLCGILLLAGAAGLVLLDGGRPQQPTAPVTDTPLPDPPPDIVREPEPGIPVAVQVPPPTASMAFHVVPTPENPLITGLPSWGSVPYPTKPPREECSTRMQEC